LLKDKENLFDPENCPYLIEGSMGLQSVAKYTVGKELSALVNERIRKQAEKCDQL